MSSVVLNGETWTFTGQLQYEAGTSIIQAAGISNLAGVRPIAKQGNEFFGIGWTLDLPAVMVEDGQVFVTLKNGNTYEATPGSGTGIKDYQLADATFAADSSVVAGSQKSAYCLTYSNGEKYFYTADGFILEQVDRFGNGLSYLWRQESGAAQLQQIQDRAGRSISLSYYGNTVAVKSGDREIFLQKEPVPAQSNCFYLSGWTDALGRQYRCQYRFEAAEFDLVGKTPAVNQYVNLVEVQYPTGAKTTYSYGQSKKHLGLSGSMEYFKIQSRRDEAQHRVYDQYDYWYGNEPDGYPVWKANAIDPAYQYQSGHKRPDGYSVVYRYNAKHQLCQKTISAQGTTRDVSIEYDRDWNVPAVVRETGQSEKGQAYSKVTCHTFANRGNLIRETVDDNRVQGFEGAFAVDYAYDAAYDLPIEKKYRRDAQTTVFERSLLTEDRKAIAEYKVYSGDQLERRIRYRYDAGGNPTRIQTQVSDGQWQTIDRVYDEKTGFLYPKEEIHRQVIDADGDKRDVCQTWEYDKATGLVKASTDRNGGVSRYLYDQAGRLIRRTEPNQAGASWRYDDRLNSVIATDAEGHSLTYSFDPLGNLRQVQGETGRPLVQFCYDANGRPVVRIDGNLNQRQTDYDPLDREVRIRDCDEAGTILSEMSLDYAEAIPDEKGQLRYRITTTRKGESKDQVTHYYFDGREQLVAKEWKVAENTVRETFQRDALGHVREQIDVQGGRTEFKTNLFGQILEERDPSGRVKKIGYDQMGNALWTEDGLGHRTVRTYDQLGRIIGERLPGSDREAGQSRFYYDDNGSLVKSVDPVGLVVKNTYDEVGNLIGVEQLSGQEASEQTRMEYDRVGRLVKLERGGRKNGESPSAITRYAYDAQGQVLAETDPLGSVARLRYDGNGNVIQKTDRNDVTTTFTYDGLNRLVGVVNSRDGEKERVRYRYDRLGNRTAMEDATGERHYRYNDRNQLEKILYPQGITENYRLNASGQTAGFQVLQGSQEEIGLEYEYDPAGRLTAVSDHGVRTTYEYDAAGYLKTARNGQNGVKTEYAYTPAGNLAELKNGIGDQTTEHDVYRYDPAGYCVEAVENGERTEYSYDRLGRLSAVCEKDRYQKYTYDALNNIDEVLEIWSGRVKLTDYQYDRAGRLVKAESDSGRSNETQLFRYDAEGNQTGKVVHQSWNGKQLASAEQAFTYNGSNRLIRICDESGVSAEYRYDGDGLRNVCENRQGVTRYLYDQDRLVMEFDEAGRPTATTIWGKDRQLYRQADGKTLYDTFNGHGDVTKVKDRSGKELATYAYDAFGAAKATRQPLPILLLPTGEILPENETYGGVPASSVWRQEVERIDNPFRYCGEYYDASSGTYYLRARDYDPTIGRFVTEDTNRGEPGNALSLNLYIYCWNNPDRYVDSTGNWPEIKEVTRTLAKWLIANPAAAYITQNGYCKEQFYALGFSRDSHGIYHARPDAWQQVGGFNELYDVVFDYATNMQSETFRFTSGGREFIFWAWKGDYLNLGAGAELGIYSNQSGILGHVNVNSPFEGHWLVDTSLAMKMTLTLDDKDGNQIFSYGPREKQWWITGFNPYRMGVKADDLTATYTVTFNSRAMYNDNYNKFGDKDSKRRDPRWKFNPKTLTVKFKF